MAVATRVAVGDTVVVPDTVEVLFRRYHAKLIRFLSARVRNDEDAADLAQETYGRLLRLQGERD